MIARRRALSAAAACALVVGAATAWALTPGRVRAGTPAAAAAAAVPQAAPLDPWASGPVDQAYMVRGVLDYRSDTAPLVSQKKDAR